MGGAYGRKCLGIDGGCIDGEVSPRILHAGENGLRMSARVSASLSRANGAQFVVDHFSRGWRLMQKKKKWRGQARNLAWEVTASSSSNMAHTRQSRPDSGLGFQEETIKIF
jgi:hypothetical protein